MSDAVIAGYVRSPFHFATKGALARTRPDDLTAAVVKGLVEKTGIDPKDEDAAGTLGHGPCLGQTL